MQPLWCRARRAQRTLGPNYDLIWLSRPMFANKIVKTQFVVILFSSVRARVDKCPQIIREDDSLSYRAGNSNFCENFSCLVEAFVTNRKVRGHRGFAWRPGPLFQRLWPFPCSFCSRIRDVDQMKARRSVRQRAVAGETGTSASGR